MIGAIGCRGLFLLRGLAPRVHLVLVLLLQTGEIVESESEDSSPGDGGQNSHDTWKNIQPQGKRKEIFAVIDAVGTTVKERTNTWNKSCEESVKRETELTVQNG